MPDAAGEDEWQIDNPRTWWQGRAALSLCPVVLPPSLQILLVTLLFTSLPSIQSHAGEDEWQIDDPRTWRDPDAVDKEAPIGDTDNLFIQVSVGVCTGSGGGQGWRGLSTLGVGRSVDRQEWPLHTLGKWPVLVLLAERDRHQFPHYRYPALSIYC